MWQFRPTRWVRVDPTRRIVWVNLNPTRRNVQVNFHDPDPTRLTRLFQKKTGNTRMKADLRPFRQRTIQDSKEMQKCFYLQEE